MHDSDFTTFEWFAKHLHDSIFERNIYLQHIIPSLLRAQPNSKKSVPFRKFRMLSNEWVHLNIHFNNDFGAWPTHATVTTVTNKNDDKSFDQTFAISLIQSDRHKTIQTRARCALHLYRMHLHATVRYSIRTGGQTTQAQ